ncbi:MAG: mechanosensitive ion channel family protein, partial [Candidatus Binataceae bacterium]
VEPTALLDRGRAWLRLRQKIDSIERRIAETDGLRDATHQSRSALQQAMIQLGAAARGLVGQAGAEPGESPATIEARKRQFEVLLDRRKQIAAALLPLSRMSLLFARYDANLKGWRDEEAQRAIAELSGLVTRAITLSIILAVLLAVGMGWRSVASRYVEDRHRRSQMVLLRNVVIGILIAIVLAFEFVSEISSLATMIGLATAGIAVALQDVILSIAGYFRIGGRFGIKIGDWIEVQGVRGEVINIGLTKLTLMELGGEGGQREPTGRLAVLPNSVVFRDKFANRAYGTGLGWDEIELMISPDCDYRMVEKRLTEAVDEVFARYRDVARAESRQMARRFNLKMEPPRPQSRIKLSPEGVRLTVRYPVDVRVRNQVMDEISRRLLDSFKRDPSIRLIPQAAANLQPNPDGVQPAAGQTQEPPPPAARASKA